VPLAILAILGLEADLTLTAVVIGLTLRRRRSGVTLLATALVALATAAAVFLVWALWVVAPLCLGASAPAGCIVERAAVGSPYLIQGATAQLAWMLAVAFCARFVSEKNVAHVSG